MGVGGYLILGPFSRDYGIIYIYCLCLSGHAQQKQIVGLANNLVIVAA